VTAVLWARSYQSCNLIKHSIGKRWYIVAVIGDGQIRASLTHSITRPVPHISDYRSWANSGGVQPWMVSTGFGLPSLLAENKWWGHEEFIRNERFNAVGPDYEFWCIALPGWLGVTVFSILPLAALVRLVYSRAVLNPKWCQKCRYPLTGNTSGTCPECGTPASLQSPKRPKQRLPAC